MNRSNVEETLIEHEIDWTETPPSIAVAYAVASLENKNHEDLPPIHEYVETESLDELVTESEDVSVSFSVREFTVEIRDSLLIVKQGMCRTTS